MNNEQKRIAIAEACGWTFAHSEKARTLIEKEELDFAGVPDYLNDLNAMHEAEKSLTDIQWIGYAQRLKEITMHGGGEGNFSPSRWIHATASQRADAFLKTIGKLP